MATDKKWKSEDITRIQFDDTLNYTRNYVDKRVHIDLEEASPQHLKSLLLPLPLAVFMPLEWDLNGSSTDYNTYFGIPALIEERDQSLMSEMENYIEIGEDSSYPDYAETQAVYLRQSSSYLGEREVAFSKTKSGKTIELHPMKLLNYASAYEKEALSDPLSRDLFDLIYDKIALAALLPFLFENWPKAPDTPEEAAGSEAVEALKTIDGIQAYCAKQLIELDPLNFPKDDALLLKATPIEIQDTYWKDLFAYTAIPEDEPDFIRFPLDDLDGLLSDHLNKAFDKEKRENTEVDWSIVSSLIRDEKRLDVRDDHGFFYPVLDEYLKERRREVRMSKLLYEKESTASNTFPFIEFIDMRPLSWEKEATIITTEMNISSSRYKIAKAKLKTLQEKGDQASQIEFEEIAGELRRATQLWHDSKRRFDILAELVGREGWELTLKGEDKEQTIDVGQFFTITKKVAYMKTVVVEKRALKTTIIKKPYRKCWRVRVGFFKVSKCRTKYRKKKHTSWKVWKEKELKEVVENQEVDLQYDPIGHYLNTPIHKSAFTSTDNAEKFFERQGEALPAADVNTDRYVSGKVKNGDKKVFTFSYVNGDYIDESGMSLDSLLSNIDAPSVLNDLKLDDVIFLIPSMKRRIDGEMEVVGYHAVHKPSKGRGSLIQPDLFLRETYELSVGQMAGHWLGNISHSVSLFPGEERTFKLITEQRLDTKSFQEGSESTRTTIQQSTDVYQRVASELERENKSSQSSSWKASASGSGSYGAFSAKASASASGKSSQSSRNLSKNLSDRTQKALNESSRDNEVHFKTTEETQKSSSVYREQTVKFSNVNQGHAVNYKFFQVLHRYESRVKLADLELEMLYYDEIIPGLDITRTKTLPLNQLDDLFPEIIPSEQRAIKEKVLTFVKERHAAQEIKNADGTIETVDFLDIDDETSMINGLNPGNYLRRDHQYVNSGAFFVDTEVSTQHATEEYINQIRANEIAYKKAQTTKVEKEAIAIGEGKIVLPGSIEQLNLEISGQTGLIINNDSETEATD